MIKNIRPFLVLSVFLALSPACAMAESQESGDRVADTYQQLNLFGEVFERIRREYVEIPDDKKLVEAAINGMLTSLDPHSSYLDRQSFMDMQVQTKGEFGGLGIEVTMENGLVKVVSPIDDTPAYKAGLKPNDLVVAIDDAPVMGLTLTQAVEKMRGPAGSKIKISIKREGASDPFDVSLTRAVIKIQSVRHRMEGNVGYIRITTFNDKTQSGVEKAIEDIQDKLGNDLVGYVLDLRNNPGGLLDQSILVADDFLDKGEIVSTRGRPGKESDREEGLSPDNRVYSAQPGDLAHGKPVVVLINGGSASASEIVAGALQDHRRAVVMGTQSFGKGSVQSVIPMPPHGAIRLTTARYYTPSGRSIQAKGIAPDIEVQPARVEEIEQGIRRREADLPGALKNDKDSSAKETIKNTPSKEKLGPESKAPVEPSSTGGPASGVSTAGEAYDYQLARALDLLRGVSLYNNARKDN